MEVGSQVLALQRVESAERDVETLDNRTTYLDDGVARDGGRRRRDARAEAREAADHDLPRGHGLGCLAPYGHVWNLRLRSADVNTVPYGGDPQLSEAS